MKHYITNRADYQHTVDINPCHRPDDTTHLRFEHKSIDENGKVFHSSNYEMFLDKNQVAELIKSLQTV